MGVNYAAGGARPIDELGSGDFQPFKRPSASFPSNHATVMWAAVTPFAKEYGMPWLYGLATLTNVARAASREHWVSDTVASSLLGYAVGSFFWEQRRKPGDAGPMVGIGPNGVALMWETK